MAKRALIFKRFDGGLATTPKIGIANSFAGQTGSGSLGSYALDFRKDPSQLSVLPGPMREDQGTVTDLIQNEVMARDGSIYAIGNRGAFYKRTTAGVWSQVANLNVGTAGIDYRYDTDSIYITQNKSVSLYNNVSGSNGTPAMYMSYYAASYSTSNNDSILNLPYTVAAYQAGSSLTTTLGTTPISENTVNRRYFQSDIEPLKQVSFFVVNKGTGDWTATLHDGNNNVLATSTITNANLVNNTFNNFVFTNAPNGQVRIYVAPNARTYHLHLTSTVADGTVSSSSANNLSTCDLQVWADRMVMTQNGLHPMTRFQQYEVIGNGNYLTIWEPITDPPTNDEWQRHKLVFPMEYEVCGIAVFNEYLAIACQYTSTSTSSEPQKGLIFWWDGLSATYNYFTAVPEGTPQCIHEYKNMIYYYASGAWYAIGSPASQPVKIRTMPGTDTEYSGAAAPITVYPYSATVRRGIHLMGWPGMTTSTGINYGVYSWGSVDKNYPESFGYSYLISTGSTNYSAQNNLTIGMVKNFGDTLHISWRDTSSDGGYGIDVVNNTSIPAANSSWESIIFDNGFVSKKKKGIYIQAAFITLPSDCSFKLKYKIDRGSWVYSSTFTAATIANYPAKNYAQLNINDPSEFFEIQVGIDVVSGTTTSQFTNAVLVFDDNREQALM